MMGLGFSSNAQTYEVPVDEDFEFEDAESYKKYEDDILECANYLVSHSSEAEGYKWNEAAAFLMKWIIGAPDYTVQMRPETFEYIHKKNSSLLFYFIAGWVKEALENQHDDAIEGNKAGMLAMMKAYETYDNWKKDKKLQKLIDQNKEDPETLNSLVRSWYRE